MAAKDTVTRKDAAYSVVAEMSDDLKNSLPIAGLITALFAKKVITRPEKAAMDAIPVPFNKTEYLIFDVLLNDLQQRTDKFDKFVEVLKKSADGLAKHFATKLEEEIAKEMLPGPDTVPDPRPDPDSRPDPPERKSDKVKIEDLQYNGDDLQKMRNEIEEKFKKNTVGPKNRVAQQICLLLMTVNDKEFNAALYYLSKDSPAGVAMKLFHPKGIYYIGKIGGIPTALFKQAKQGISGAEGSANATHVAISVFPNLKFIVAVGVCGTFAELGNVIVSSRIDGYDHLKIQKGGDAISRSSQNYPGKRLWTLLNDSGGWSFRCTKEASPEYKSKAVIQPFLSAPFLVAYGQFRDQMKKCVSQEAAGIEMEGIGVVNQLRTDGKEGIIEFIIVKAGCDYADETKHKGWQPVAAMAAADLVYSQLSGPGVIYTLEVSSGGDGGDQPDKNKKHKPETTTGNQPTIPQLTDCLRTVTNLDTLAIWLLPETSYPAADAIKINNRGDVEGHRNALIREFYNNGNKTWETVINAVRKAGYGNLADDIEMEHPF